MLNSKNERELCYFVYVDDVSAMDADRLECAHVSGWNCVVGKGEFKKGDIAVYFEIDSKVPEVEPFTSMEFLASKHFKIKSQKIRGVVSQGLLMPVSAFGWEIRTHPCHNTYVDAGDNKWFFLEDDSRFLTKELNVTYAVFEDNARKTSSGDKYKKMAQRHPKLARKKWWRWMMKRSWGKKLLFAFFGKKRDKKSGWPAWVVKTDEERVQNMPFLFPNNLDEWVVTEKIDGSSFTATMRKSGLKREFHVCSRNVVFDNPDKPCFYDTNIYVEMAEKYHIKEKLAQMLEMESGRDVVFVTLQGEVYGAGVQKRDYGLTGHDLRIFNVIFGYKDGTTQRLNPIDGKRYMQEFGIPFVPIVARSYFLPTSCEDLLTFADGKSLIDGGMREGLVFRSLDGVKSFKAVSNKYLLKYHG